MDRRAFLGVAAGLAGGALRALGETDMLTPADAQRFTRTVKQLRSVSPERRATLIANPEAKSPLELNRMAPEMEEIELLNDALDASDKDILRVLAWNMERGRHWREAVQLVREHPALHDPDIILLGEMDLGMARSGNEHTTREFAAALGMNYAYGIEFLELSGGEKHEREQYPGDNAWGYHGNAILSVFPLHNLRVVRFPGIDKWYGAYQNRLGGRIALCAEIAVAGRRITLVSTHLESGITDARTRAMQGRLLVAELDQHASGLPVILGGDMNAIPAEPVIRAYRDAGFLVEACNDTTGGTAQRLRDGKLVLPGKPIDYILLRGLDAVADATSPQRVPAVYPPGETGALLGDHAVVTVKVAAA